MTEKSKPKKKWKITLDYVSIPLFIFLIYKDYSDGNLIWTAAWIFFLILSLYRIFTDNTSTFISWNTRTAKHKEESK